MTQLYTDHDFDRGTPIYYCPVCDLLRAGWLLCWQRDAHMIRKHPEHPAVEGSGLVEWRAWRQDSPLRAGKVLT